LKPEDSGLIAVASYLAGDGRLVQLKSERDEGGGELEIARVK
jgi:hypothetical protein